MRGSGLNGNCAGRRPCAGAELSGPGQQIGTETAHGIDPEVKFLLAGGLFPRSFRNELLKAGVGQYVDVLPVHYSDGAGVYEARADLDAAGCAQVAVWDDETAHGTNAWNTPPLEDLAATEQSKWVVNHFTDELEAGAERIVYFGGRGDPCGSWAACSTISAPVHIAATLCGAREQTARRETVGKFLRGPGHVSSFRQRRPRDSSWASPTAGRPRSR